WTTSAWPRGVGARPHVHARLVIAVMVINDLGELGQECAPIEEAAEPAADRRDYLELGDAAVLGGGGRKTVSHESAQAPARLSLLVDECKALHRLSSQSWALIHRRAGTSTANACSDTARGPLHGAARLVTIGMCWASPSTS